MIPKKHLIFGIHPILEALRANEDIEKIFIQQEIKLISKKELFELASINNIPVQFVPAAKLKKLTTENHQGVLAIKSQISFQNIEHLVPWWFENGIQPLVLALDEITDVNNLGAIARTAECAGFNAIIIPIKNSAQINAQTVKASSGALFKIPVCRTKNLIDTINFLKQSGFIFIAATEKAAKNYTKADYLKPTVIILGSEEYGISKSVLNIADEHVSIPIFGSVKSLNVSVAAAVLIYEAIRQREKL